MLPAFLFGWVGGGILLSYVSDKVGRARVIGYALVGAVIGSALSPLAQTATSLSLVRVGTGACVGAVMAVSITFGAETLPNSRRPYLMGLLVNSYAFGIVLTGILQSRSISFEVLSYSTLLFGVVALPFTISNKWLVATGEKPNITGNGETNSVSARHVLLDHRGQVLIGSALFGCMLIALWATFSWVPTWASERFISADGGAAIRGAAMMALGIGGIVGSVISGVVTKLLGLTKGIVLCYVGAITLSFCLYGITSISQDFFLAGVFALTIFFGLSQGLMATYIPSLFPRVIRATGVGLCFNIGRIVTALAMIQMGVIASALGGYREALLIFSLVLVAGLIATRRAPTPVNLETT